MPNNNLEESCLREHTTVVVYPGENRKVELEPRKAVSVGSAVTRERNTRLVGRKSLESFDEAY